MLQQGNRSSSSACGSADVLENLGVAIDMDPKVNIDIFEFKLIFWTANNSYIQLKRPTVKWQSQLKMAAVIFRNKCQLLVKTNSFFPII